jgi:hypothetical protein
MRVHDRIGLIRSTVRGLLNSHAGHVDPSGDVVGDVRIRHEVRGKLSGLVDRRC